MVCTLARRVWEKNPSTIFSPGKQKKPKGNDKKMHGNEKKMKGNEKKRKISKNMLQKVVDFC